MKGLYFDLFDFWKLFYWKILIEKGNYTKIDEELLFRQTIIDYWAIFSIF